MFKQMFKATAAAAFALIVISASAMSVCARDYDPAMLEPEKPMDTITVSLECGDDFSERVEIYFDGVPRTSLWRDERIENNGYKRTVQVESGIYQIKALSSTDLNDVYEFTAPEVFDTSSGETLTIRVTETGNTEEDEDSDHEGMEIPEAPVLTPAYFDFTDGGPGGVLHINAKNHGSVEQASFTLVGNGKMYEVVLDNEHAFYADVKLPAGSYYESSNIDVELAEHARVNEDVTFLWSHSDNEVFWGNYYDVTDGSEQTISDLAIMISYGGETFELTDAALFSGYTYDNLEQAREEHQQKELVSEFPDMYSFEETPAGEQPTIPAVEKTETPRNRLHEILGVAAAAVGIIIAFVVIRMLVSGFRKRKDNEED